MFHVNRLEWGPDDASASELQHILNAEDQAGFWLDRIVPVVYQVETDDGQLEQRSDLVVITGDRVLQN